MREQHQVKLINKTWRSNNLIIMKFQAFINKYDQIRIYKDKDKDSKLNMDFKPETINLAKFFHKTTWQYHKSTQYNQAFKVDKVILKLAQFFQVICRVWVSKIFKAEMNILTLIKLKKLGIFFRKLKLFWLKKAKIQFYIHQLKLNLIRKCLLFVSYVMENVILLKTDT